MAELSASLRDPRTPVDNSCMPFQWKRRDLLKIGAAGLAAGMLAPRAEAASLFGRMFAVPARDTSYFTPNDKFYIVNYSDSPFSVSRDLNADQWQRRREWLDVFGGPPFP